MKKVSRNKLTIMNVFIQFYTHFYNIYQPIFSYFKAYIHIKLIQIPIQIIAIRSTSIKWWVISRFFCLNYVIQLFKVRKL